MTRKPSKVAWVGILVAGLAAPAFGAQANQTEDSDALRQEVSQLRAEIAELRQQQQKDSGQAERRAHEVQALVHDLLADAETRSSFQAQGITAGHDGNNFFLGSTDDRFRLHLGGQVQARFMANIRDDTDVEVGIPNGVVNTHTVPDDKYAVGFEVPRVKLNAWGHIASPRLEYSLTLRGDERVDNADRVYVQEALISYEMLDGLKLWGGQTKAPFAREELIDSSRQLAVERSLVNQAFTIGAVQGIGVDYEVYEMVRLSGSFNDGIRSGEPLHRNGAPAAKLGATNNKGFIASRSDFALTGRVDVKLAGSWDQADEFTAWQGEPMAVFLGGGAHFEKGETGTDADNNDFWTWTIDGSVKHLGWSAFGSVNHLRTDFAEGDNSEMWGLVAQGAYNIDDTYEPFVRWEYLDLSTLSTQLGEREDNYLNFITAGLNWYNNRHNAKLTADVVWAMNAVPESHHLNTSSSDLRLLGLKPDPAGDDDQIALRLQYQLLF